MDGVISFFLGLHMSSVISSFVSLHVTATLLFSLLIHGSYGGHSVRRMFAKDSTDQLDHE